MSSTDEEEDLTKSFEDLSLNKKDEDYYIHIDVLCKSSSTVARKINKFLIKNDAYDPRRSTTFPTDLMEIEDRKKEKKKGPNLQLRRTLAGNHGDKYYELWKVHRDFSLERFNEKVVQDLPSGVKIRVVRIINNDHEITKYTSE